jgi:cysteine-rich repeat protein
LRGLALIAILIGCGDDAGMPCPALAPNCDDGDPCTIDQIVGTCPGTCRHDPAPAGPSDQCCPMGATQRTDPDCAPRCGDGVVDPGEQCDDGNNAPLDGCSAACKIEEGLIIHNLAWEDQSLGCDLDGDGAIDNILSHAMNNPLRLAFNSFAQGAIQRGNLYLDTIFVITDLDDPTGVANPNAHLAALFGQDADLSGSNNFDGTTPFPIDSRTAPMGSPIGGWTPVAIQGGNLTGSAPLFVLPLSMFSQNPSSPTGYQLAKLARFQLFGQIMPGNQRIAGFSGGRICGAMTISSLAHFENFTGSAGQTFLDVLVLGVTVASYQMTATQPDIDVDNDGLERLSDTDGDNHIDLCVDGNGTQIQGVDCVDDPRIADGYSTSVAIDAVAARLGGIAP